MKIGLFQDTVCPWCRVGKAHLFKALEQFQQEPVEVRYHAFLLDPTTPPEGRPMSSLVERLGGQARADEMHARVCQIGEACGVDFQFEKIDHIPNTMRSHELIKLAPLDRQEAVVQELHDAYFSRGEDIGDMEVLLEVARRVGLDTQVIQNGLLHEEKRAEVLEDLQFARDAGISGVPFFIFDGKYALSGAQPVEVFVQVLEQISSGNVLE